MAYEPGAIEAAISAAVGDDTGLQQELRNALIESAERHADLMRRSRCDANWRTAAWRLKGLAASFGAVDLITATDVALEGAPGDPVALRGVNKAIDALR